MLHNNKAASQARKSVTRRLGVSLYLLAQACKNKPATRIQEQAMLHNHRAASQARKSVTRRLGVSLNLRKPLWRCVQTIRTRQALHKVSRLHLSGQ